MPSSLSVNPGRQGTHVYEPWVFRQRSPEHLASAVKHSFTSTKKTREKKEEKIPSSSRGKKRVMTGNKFTLRLKSKLTERKPGRRSLNAKHRNTTFLVNYWTQNLAFLAMLILLIWFAIFTMVNRWKICHKKIVTQVNKPSSLHV